MNAKAFFLSNHIEIDFGIAQSFGRGAEELPEFGAKTATGVYQTGSLDHLSENLKTVNCEVSGHYKWYATSYD